MLAAARNVARGKAIRHAVDDFQLGQRAMRYNPFAPRLCNYCLSLGFRRARTMPSRAFCSDESRGYPVIPLMRHFGAFPFDHGRVGGKVATDRHGPHAHHGEDLVIVQAGHVGYDPARRRFGVRQRARTADRRFGDNCGKLCAILRWHEKEYGRARENILFGAIEARPAVLIDNLLPNPDRDEGLFLRRDRLIAKDRAGPLDILSASKAFRAAPDLVASAPADVWRRGRTPIADRLTPDMFFFRRTPIAGPEGHDLLEASLAPAMPTLASSGGAPASASAAATISRQRRVWP